MDRPKKRTSPASKPDAKVMKVGIMLPAAVYEQLGRQAKRWGLSRAGYTRQALAERLVADEAR